MNEGLALDVGIPFWRRHYGCAAYLAKRDPALRGVRVERRARDRPIGLDDILDAKNAHE